MSYIILLVIFRLHTLSGDHVNEGCVSPSGESADEPHLTLPYLRGGWSLRATQR